MRLTCSEFSVSSALRFDDMLCRGMERFWKRSQYRQRASGVEEGAKQCTNFSRFELRHNPTRTLAGAKVGLTQPQIFQHELFLSTQ
jgi:hypothetical protein